MPLSILSQTTRVLEINRGRSKYRIHIIYRILYTIKLNSVITNNI